MRRGHRAIQIPEILGRGGTTRMKSRGNGEEIGCAREINPLLRHERNTFNYVLLHFIGMYTSYLAACKPRITQRESTMKNERIKTQTKKKKMLLKLESLRRRNNPALRPKQMLGTKAPSALMPGPGNRLPRTQSPGLDCPDHQHQGHTHDGIRRPRLSS